MVRGSIGSILRTLAPPEGWEAFVVWDGDIEAPYRPTGIDIALPHDSKPVVIQEIWSRFLRAGHEVVVVFACKPRQFAHEHEAHGVFSSCALSVLQQADQARERITLRDYITRINKLMRGLGFDQQSEVICRAHLLEQYFLEFDAKGGEGARVVLQLDMCRA